MKLSEDATYLLYCMDQLKGTIDWNTIAKQLNLVSAGAASQKLVRMKKQFRDDLAANGTGEVESSTSPSSSPTKSSSGNDVLSPDKKGNRVTKRGGGKAKGMRRRGKKAVITKRDDIDDEVEEYIEFTSDE